MLDILRKLFVVGPIFYALWWCVVRLRGSEERDVRQEVEDARRLREATAEVERILDTFSESS